MVTNIPHFYRIKIFMSRCLQQAIIVLYTEPSNPFYPLETYFSKNISPCPFIYSRSPSFDILGLSFCRGLSSYSLPNTGLCDVTAHTTAVNTVSFTSPFTYLLYEPVINSNYRAWLCKTKWKRSLGVAIVVYFNVSKDICLQERTKTTKTSS